MITSTNSKQVTNGQLVMQHENERKLPTPKRRRLGTWQAPAMALAVFLIPAASAAAQAPPTNLEQAMQAVFSGPKKKVKIHGHKFKFRKIKMKVRGNTVHFSGRISRPLKIVRDSQIRFSFTLVNGVLQGPPKIKIKARGWKEAFKVARWLVKRGKEVWDYMQQDKKDGSIGQQRRSLAITSSKIWKIGRKPSWKKVAQALVYEIAMRAGKDGRDKVRSLKAAAMSKAKKARRGKRAQTSRAKRGRIKGGLKRRRKANKKRSKRSKR